MTIEEYINKRKKEDELNEFDISKKMYNLKLINDYAYEYFNDYLNKTDLEKEAEEKSIKAAKYRKNLEFYSPKIQDWLIEIYKIKNIKLNYIITRVIDDPVFPLYTEEAEYDKLSYCLYAKLNKKYPFIIDYMDNLKQFLKEYHDLKNNSENISETYKLAHSDKINSWVQETNDKYNINLQAFAEYYADLFSNVPSWWDKTYYLDPENKTVEWYDISKSKDLFAINSLYTLIQDKPFINGKKNELIVLILMYYRKYIDGNIPESLVEKCLNGLV